MNYNSIPALKDAETGRRYYPCLKYPVIPLSESDIYTIAVFGDRLDVLSDHYYGNTDDAWIISTANGLAGDSLFFTPGSQIRIPMDVISVKDAFNRLNNLN
jgi:hypothetical protein